MLLRSKLFFCLRLPIPYNAWGRWPKYYVRNVKYCWFDAASQVTYLYYCLWLPIQSNARRRWPKYFALNVKCCGLMLLRSKLILLSSAPNPKQCKGEVTKILFMECKVLRGCCCFAANLLYCLWLPIQFNARGKWPKYYAWNVKSCGFDTECHAI